MATVATLQFASLAIMSRILEPSDFGLMGMIMVVIGFARLFADMGISNAIIYHQDTTKEELSSLYWLNILSGVIIFFIVCVSSPLITAFYREPRLSNLIYLASLNFLITPLGQQFQILLQKELKFDELAKIEIISYLAHSAAAIILASMGMGVFSLIWGQLVGASFKILLLSCWGWKNWHPILHFSIQDLKGYIKFGIYQMGEKTANYFISNIDYLLIGYMIGVKALGYYTLAYNIILRPSIMINPIITRVAFPVFSKIQNDAVALKKSYLKILQLLSTVNFPLMMGLLVVAPIGVPIIFGEKWLSSVVLVQILTFVGLLRSIGNPIGSLLLAKGRADMAFKWTIAIMIIQIPGLYLGARLGDVVGVAVAYAFLICIYSVFNYLILIRTLLSPCLHDYIHSMWPALWMSGAMALMVFAVGIILRSGSPTAILIVQVLCGALVYLGLMACYQRALLVEIKGMIFDRKVAIANE